MARNPGHQPTRSSPDQAPSRRQGGSSASCATARSSRSTSCSPATTRFSAPCPMAPRRSEDDIPLMLPEEQRSCTAQDQGFQRRHPPGLATAAKSTVSIWAGIARLAYGTVIGDGTRILSKWSEIARASRQSPHRRRCRRGSRRVNWPAFTKKRISFVLDVEGEPAHSREMVGRQVPSSAVSSPLHNRTAGLRVRRGERVGAQSPRHGSRLPRRHRRQGLHRQRRENRPRSSATPVPPKPDWPREMSSSKSANARSPDCSR